MGSGYGSNVALLAMRREWVSYACRDKPQNLRKPPGIYAPVSNRGSMRTGVASLERGAMKPL